MTKTKAPPELLEALDEKLKLKLDELLKLKLLLDELLELELELLEELLDELVEFDAHTVGGQTSSQRRGRHHQPPLTCPSSSAISSRILVSPVPPPVARPSQRNLPSRGRHFDTLRGPRWDRSERDRGQRTWLASSAATTPSSTIAAMATAMMRNAAFFCAAAPSSPSSRA